MKIHTNMGRRKLKYKSTKQLFKRTWNGRDLHRTEMSYIKRLTAIYAAADNSTYLWEH